MWQSFSFSFNYFPFEYAFNLNVISNRREKISLCQSKISINSHPLYFGHSSIHSTNNLGSSVPGTVIITLLLLIHASTSSWKVPGVLHCSSLLADSPFLAKVQFAAVNQSFFPITFSGCWLETMCHCEVALPQTLPLSSRGDIYTQIPELFMGTACSAKPSTPILIQPFPKFDDEDTLIILII